MGRQARKSLIMRDVVTATRQRLDAEFTKAMEKRRVRYEPEVLASIIERLENGENLAAICMEPGYPAVRTVYTLIDQLPVFKQAFVRAREVQAHAFADKTVIAVESLADKVAKGKAGRDDIEVTKLVVGVYQWRAGLQAPEQWGGQAGKSGGGGNVTITINPPDNPQVVDIKGD
jgi:hypothetical protein